MRIIVRSKTMPVTKALRTFVKKQAEKIDRLGRRVTKVAVYLEQIRKKRNDPQSAVVKYQVRLPGKDIVVKRRAADTYDAIVDVTNRVVRQVRKLKERRLQKSRAKQDELAAEQLA